MDRLPQCVRIFSLLPLALGILLLAASSATAGNSKIAGRVLAKQNREPLAGANVVLTQKVLSGGTVVPLDRSLGAAADPDGYYFILDVPPGVYHLKASAVGYAAETQRLVNIESDRTISVDFQLESAELQLEGVEVVATRELIRADVSATQEIISTSRIEQMPVLRIDEFIGKLKGVALVSTPEGNGLSVRGGSIRETDIRIDGMSLQDPRTENSYLSFNSTAIQEVQVLTGGFEAKYGNIRSGLLNFVTREGVRDRYTVTLKADYTPEGQKRFFGDSPWDRSSWIYRVFAGEYAWRGVPVGDTTVPYEFRSFTGWASRSAAPALLDSTQKLALWNLQHPGYGVARRPDIFFEGAITGPVPGSFIPLFGDFADRTTFLLGFRYENTQMAFPLGPRDNYLDWNGQLRLSTALSGTMRLAVNGMLANIKTVSSGLTTSYGGALIGQASSFGFLNNTESSVSAQARLLGGDGFKSLFNKSRLQSFDQRYVIGGTKFTQTLSDRMYYTLDFQLGYTDQKLVPFAMDTSRADQWAYFTSARNGVTYRYNLPQYGSPNASTNYGFDPLNFFTMYGGPQRVDSSHSWVYQFKGDFTAQVGRFHQVEAGLSARIHNLFIYTGTWFDSQPVYSLDTWQYYKVTPLDVGLYLQDKLEFEGMILNAGLRLDYFNPMKEGFASSFPLSEEYARLYQTYASLLGGLSSFERWEAFRALLENPPGWPRTENRVQVYLSPRLGVSFPISTSSKMYFNFGHFYQRPAISFLYNTTLYFASAAVPSPDLDMARTVSYEFGYEQTFLDDFLINLTAYYKDVSGEPLSTSFIAFSDDYTLSRYFGDLYSDTRGVEVRLERPVGRFVTFAAMYEYMLKSTGQSGLARVYEDRLKASRNGELRSANVTVTDPVPRANVNLNLHTPSQFGPEFLGIHWFGGLIANFLFEWRDGGRILMNPGEPDIKQWIYADVVDWWNLDFRGSKMFDTPYGSLEFVITVENLTNNKFLTPGNMTQSQYSDYKASLKTPDKGGTDKWGEYDKDYIKTGWWTAPIFLNPRRIILGLRLNL